MFRVTGSLQERNGIYQMIVRIPDVFGIYKQKSKSTKIRVNGKNARETHTNRLMAEKMLSDWIVLLETTGCSGSKRQSARTAMRHTSVITMFILSHTLKIKS